MYSPQLEPELHRLGLAERGPRVSGLDDGPDGPAEPHVAKRVLLFERSFAGARPG